MTADDGLITYSCPHFSLSKQSGQNALIWYLKEDGADTLGSEIKHSTTHESELCDSIVI